MNRPPMQKRLRLLVLLVTIGLCPVVNSVGALGQCWSPHFSPGAVYKTTGDLQLDQKINQEGNLIYRTFGVNPNLVMFDDGPSPNALASPQTTLYGFTGTVYFGIGLFRNQLWSMDKGEAAVAGIMAHEFSHILQMKMGSSLSGRYRELHADFMAGYYLHAKSYVARADLRPFAQSLFETGDYNFRSPTHHGTPQERVAAMLAGYNTELPLTQAFQAGERYVKGDHEETADGNDNQDQSNSYREDTESDSGFCQDLGVYTRAASHNFVSLRGAPDPDAEGEGFEAKHGITGFSACTVWIYKDRSLEPSAVCQIKNGGDLEDFRSSIGACLGSSWASRTKDSSRTKEYEFAAPDGVRVRVQKTVSGRLKLWIDSPSKD